MLKKLILFLLFIPTMLAFSQEQDGDYISTMRMGPFKLGAKLLEIESAISQSIALDDNSEAIIVYKGATYHLYFWENDSDKTLRMVSSFDTKMKTRSNVSIGSNKMQIVGTYDRYSLNIWNQWDPVTEKRSDTIQGVELLDMDSGTTLLFKTKDRITIEIAVYYQEGC